MDTRHNNERVKFDYRPGTMILNRKIKKGKKNIFYTDKT